MLSDDPEVVGGRLTSDVGADFCLAMDSRPTILELSCDLTVEDAFTYPNPDRTWYKDGVLVYRSAHGDTPEINSAFYEYGNNSILQPGVIDPIPLFALSDGSLNLDWTAFNLTSPWPSVDLQENFSKRVFMSLLGSWECRLNNSLGSSSAETVLNDCGE